MNRSFFLNILIQVTAVPRLGARGPQYLRTKLRLSLHSGLGYFLKNKINNKNGVYLKHRQTPDKDKTN